MWKFPASAWGAGWWNLVSVNNKEKTGRKNFVGTLYGFETDCEFAMYYYEEFISWDTALFLIAFVMLKQFDVFLMFICTYTFKARD